MSQSDIPLVVFTVLSQTAIGLVAVSAIRQHAMAGPAGKVKTEWLAAALFIALGLGASLLHLGHPLGAPTALKHLGNAWLSREALGLSIFAGLVVLGFITAKAKVNAALAWLAAAAGAVGLFIMGMTYAPPSFPALNNAAPFVFFALTAAMLGSGFASYFTPPEKKPLVTRILAVSLVIGLVVHLATPCIWLSGSTVMRATGLAYLASPLYWAWIGAGIVIPLLAVWKTRTIPVWVPVLILAGEIMGRVAFFTLTVHASSNIGGIY
jgi:DMSO reductase anchor subunit